MIELKIKDWLEHPEEEFERLKAERERERRERLKTSRHEAETREACAAVPEAGVVGARCLDDWGRCQKRFVHA